MTSPSQLLLAYYGDDFTGSTDVMEALETSGVPTVLFLAPPSRHQLEQFPGLRAFGVAGTSRAMSKTEMDESLAPALQKLSESGASLVHYKICSTFDSSPDVGSIGRAIEIGQREVPSPAVPLLVGAPVLGRYCAFGNLFARSGLDSEPFRLDRHPTMRQHPITPMDEADLRVHLSRQTTKSIALMDLLKLHSPSPETALQELTARGAEIILFDVVHEQDLAVIGRLIWNSVSPGRPLFVAGSSGIEYALTAFWKSDPEFGGTQPGIASRAKPATVQKLVLLSGSCSPVTGRQIHQALGAGFAEVPLLADRLIDPAASGQEIKSAIRDALKRLDSHRGVILHTHLNDRDPRVPRTLDKMRELGLRPGEIKWKSGRLLGPPLGKILRGLLESARLPRVAVAGGDTSGYVARELGIEALQMVAPIAPGSPLCRIHAPARPWHNIEIIFKGGQVGKLNWIEHVMNGTATD